MFFSVRYINRLKKVSFWLFIIPCIAIIFSVLVNNLLVVFKFKQTMERGLPVNYEQNFPLTIICDEKNFYCSKFNPKKVKFNFENCEKFQIEYAFLIEGRIINSKSYLYEKFDSGLSKQLFEDRIVKKTYRHTKILNDRCIKNSKLYSFYKIFPAPFYLIEKIRNNKNYTPATSGAVNPFIYGEVSISNVVKRFPISNFFKPLLFMTSFLMIFYWITYHKIFTSLDKSKKINNFTIFGVFSGLFLFFHFYFLGTKIDNEIFNQIRKLILVLFILFEILAQFFLTKRIYLSLDQINKYIFKKIFLIKIIFVSFIVISSVFIVTILIFFNLDSKIDYILEWNYFLLLLFFYLLSFLLWRPQSKKSNL